MNASYISAPAPSRSQTANAKVAIGSIAAAPTRRRMGVCFLIDNLGMGGTELQLLHLIDLLDRSEFAPVLCLLDGSSQASREMEPRNCEVLRLGIRKLVRPSTVLGFLRFSRFLRQRRIDVLQVYFPDSTYFGVPAARLAGVHRIVSTRRDLFYWVTDNHRRLGKRLDSLYNRFFVDAMVSNCVACQQAALEAVRVAPKKLAVIDNGLALDKFATIPPLETKSGSAPVRVGIVAMLRPEKRLEVLVDAIGDLHRRGIQVQLDIAGEGPQRSLLESKILEYQLGGHVHLLGRVQDIPAFLSTIQVAVLSSETEGQSNALVEYMAAGRAVIATDVGGNRELIEPGVTGLLVPPGSSKQLADAIGRLNSSPELLGRVAGEARARALKRFSLSAMVEAHQSFYREICQT